MRRLVERLRKLGATEARKAKRASSGQRPARSSPSHLRLNPVRKPIVGHDGLCAIV